MRLRAKLSVRNDAMLSAREAAGLSQKDVASIAGISVTDVGEMERMDFSRDIVVERVPAVAGALGLSADEIMPDELTSVDASMDAVRTCDMQPAQLVGVARTRRLVLDVADPADEVSRKDTVEQLMSCLPERERSVINCRFYNNMTLKETGKAHNITTERVRQVESRAIRTMQAHAMEGEVSYR